MKTRTFAELLIGVVAYASLSGLASLAAPGHGAPAPLDARWELPAGRRRMRRRVAEDRCRHCKGSGGCEACLPSSCRVCRGSGLQPRDAALIGRLTTLWDGKT